jgi:hypothetical protein
MFSLLHKLLFKLSYYISLTYSLTDDGHTYETNIFAISNNISSDALTSMKGVIQKNNIRFILRRTF